MAKIYIKGTLEAIELDEKNARILKEDWVAGRLPDVVDIKNMAFEKRQIKAVILAGEEERELQITSLTTDDIKAELGDFVYQYDNHLSNKKAKILTPIASSDEGIIEWAKTLGAISYHDKPYPAWFVRDPEYADFSRKLSLRNELVSRKEYAQKKDIESLQGQISEVGKNFPEDPAPVEEIDPSEIPF